MLIEILPEFLSEILHLNPKILNFEELRKTLRQGRVLDSPELKIKIARGLKENDVLENEIGVNWRGNIVIGRGEERALVIKKTKKKDGRVLHFFSGLALAERIHGGVSRE